MPNRFDIFITRLETKNARNGVPLPSLGDQHRGRRDKDNAKPVRNGEAHAEKERGKHRHKHDA
ncbi:MULTISPECIES: hypothetical protein [unclassified Mesorhizobium]|uniref:hypothetical protein n=1 Tax=unclassified Mesorhizobium TaxID=325217 RepID=UPI0010933997|nr:MULTISPECIES: hypothetical protein [unclassified Mesorhizobium]TIU45562.1 MAG: hypothetical protein E5W19_29975 [Mesorhizobium sp.]MBZ9738042.1 hypothetical protein [Mesorhizobium sp. CO1-1-4]MBZ9803649.1 hypothetical protein [Mesorhizobium sp. ES1-6]MBZ9996381.1 hypothetical protein [Mesorhizobium sp. BH1-1-4]TGQ81051.1 hypothetical protein EN850_09350 [Mesorhizobium sp. M8A.F.Ca.ET.207.01.1.1]